MKSIPKVLRKQLVTFNLISAVINLNWLARA